LPESLIPLRNQNAISINDDPYFDFDMERLIGDIRGAQGYGKEDTPPEYFEPETVYIAEGPFLMGSLQGDGIPHHETPQHAVELPAYRMGIYPVTNAQYEVFIHETGGLVAPSLRWDGQSVPPGLEKHPVTGVTWHEALAYCQWLSEKTKRSYVLPNEAQWEKACRGGNTYIYPWGDEFDPTRCNHGKSTLAAVDTYAPQSEYGCFDLVGNIRQWTCTLWGEKRLIPSPRYSYPWKEDGRNDLNANSEIRRVVRGSSFKDALNLLRCGARSGQAPDDRGVPGARQGFRVAIVI
jgi:formylglycine-generating enzyme required for sulfatase activity